MSTVIGLFRDHKEVQGAVANLADAGFTQQEYQVVSQTTEAEGILGALANMNVPARDAAYFHEGIKRGGSLVLVNVEQGRAAQVQSILDHHGAEDVDQRAEADGWSVNEPHSDVGNFGDEGGSSQWGRSMLSASASRLQSRMYTRTHSDNRPVEDRS